MSPVSLLSLILTLPWDLHSLTVTSHPAQFTSLMNKVGVSFFLLSPCKASFICKVMMIWGSPFFPYIALSCGRSRAEAARVC